MSRPVAKQVAAAQNKTMGRAVLALYRSAAQPVMVELGHQLERASQRPGLALLATEDHMVGAAGNVGARAVARAPASRHWTGSATGG
ncbi:hypothetical protein SALBM311S_00495 [Streptomyces alboniger]